MLSSQRGLPGLGVSGYQIEQPMRGARLDAAEEAKFQSGRELQTSITGLEDATTITTADGSGKAGLNDPAKTKSHIHEPLLIVKNSGSRHSRMVCRGHFESRTPLPALF